MHLACTYYTRDEYAKRTAQFLTCRDPACGLCMRIKQLFGVATDQLFSFLSLNNLYDNVSDETVKGMKSFAEGLEYTEPD